MPVLWPALGLIVVLPLTVFALAGFPLTFSIPHMGRFNVSGGVEILPEFAALLLALSVYTAGFIAEVVRAGMLSVSHGQVEAAQALGLRSGLTLRLIVLPQAMRVIIPPLTSQYLNLIKNSSLAVAIGYPDSGAGFRRHGAQHHRPSGRGDRHHHGGLSVHQLVRVAVDESLRGDGRDCGALRR